MRVFALKTLLIHILAICSFTSYSQLTKGGHLGLGTLCPECLFPPNLGNNGCYNMDNNGDLTLTFKITVNTLDYPEYIYVNLWENSNPSNVIIDNIEAEIVEVESYSDENYEGCEYHSLYFTLTLPGSLFCSSNSSSLFINGVLLDKYGNYLTENNPNLFNSNCYPPTTYMIINDGVYDLELYEEDNYNSGYDIHNYIEENNINTTQEPSFFETFLITVCCDNIVAINNLDDHSSQFEIANSNPFDSNTNSAKKAKGSIYKNVFYPNPFNSVLNYNWRENDYIQIFNSMGDNFTSTVNKTKHGLMTNNLPAGIYYIEIRNEELGEILIQKLIKY